MLWENKLLIGKGDLSTFLLPNMANRHGLVAGATGTGKTTTLKVMAESFSSIGVPVFLADVKGDVASLVVPGTPTDQIKDRLEKMGVENFSYESFPVQFWDLYGESGVPVRTTVSQIGPIMLSRILGLNDVQSGVLSIVFRIADDRGLLLLDLKDLKAMVQYVGENAKEFLMDYGNIAPQSIGAIIRSLLTLEDNRGDLFFGEPELDFSDWLKVSPEGKGYINILDSTKLYLNPELYSTFLLWMLSELFENLPEIGDPEKPRIVFFFDEAHLLFNDAPKALLQKIEQVVRLIRSKGVGVYFVTQSPMDLPKDVLSQLGNRVQHALRAYTPAELKIVNAAAESFRVNPDFDTAKAITELGTGEALVSFLDEEGKPSIVERALVMPPQSAFGSIDASLRNQLIMSSPAHAKYAKAIDRESAYEVLIARVEKQQEESLVDPKEEERLEKLKQWQEKEDMKVLMKQQKQEQSNTKKATSGYQRQTTLEKTTNAVMTTMGREVARSLIRGVLGSMKK